MEQLHTTSVERTITLQTLRVRFAALQADINIPSAKKNALELAESALAIAADLLKELKSAEQRHLDLTAALPQMLWTTRPDGFHIYFNQRWVEYTGRRLCCAGCDRAKNATGLGGLAQRGGDAQAACEYNVR